MPDSPESEEFIRQTNAKYGHSNATSLVGDFILLKSDPQVAGKYFCRFEVRYLYDEFLRGDWSAVDHIVDEHVKHGASIDTSVLSSLENYSLVKDKLILCLRNIVNGKIRFRNSVFQKCNDMAMVLYVIVKDDGKGNRLVAPVPRPSTVPWEMEDDDIFAAALENTARLSPPRMYDGFGEIIAGDTAKGEFMNALAPVRRIPAGPEGAIISAIPNTDGAVAMFYLGVKERLSVMAGGDYYIVFTGKDEAHIHLPNTVSVKSMRSVLHDSNRHFPEDMLTSNIYLYDSKKRVFRKV